MKLDRRQFANLGAGSVAGLLSQSLWAEQTHIASSPESFYFALIADTHIIDDFYIKGSENGVEDNSTILQTTEHLTFARSVINAIKLPNGQKVERTFLVGDVFHNYPSADYDFYFKNRTRLDNAADLLVGFNSPVHMGWGNHDYEGDPSRGISRDFSHRLFELSSKRSPTMQSTTRAFVSSI